MAETLQRDFDTNVKSGLRDKSVASALKLYQTSRLSRNEEEDAWTKVSEQYLNSFNVYSTETTQIYSKLLFQAHTAVVKRMKRPDRRFLSDGMDALALEALRDGVNSVQDWGGLTEALISDWGAYHKFLLFGNAFVMMSAGEDDETPVKYQNLSLTNVYVDPYATSMRNPAGENDVGEMLVVFEYSYDEAKELYPNSEFLPGKLPISQDLNTLLQYTSQQEQEMADRVVQVGHYYNISNKKKPVYTIMAGASATVIKKFEDKKYMYWHRKKPFIPVLHFKCFPQPAGFYAKGIGQLLFDIAVLEQKIDNLAYAHVEENVYPLTLLNAASGTSKKLLNDIYASRELRALGERSYVVNEVPATGGQSGLQSLTSAPLTQEYERIKADLILKVKRCGFPIDEMDRPASETATASTLETAALTAFVQQIQEVNTETYRDADLFTIDILRDTVSTESQIKIYTNVELESGAKVADKTGGITLGTIVDALEAVDVTVDVISRSGAHKDPIIEKMELNEMLPLIQGTPLAPKFIAQRLRMNGLTVKQEDLMQAQNAGLEQTPQSPAGAPQGTNQLGEAGGVGGVGDLLGSVR